MRKWILMAVLLAMLAAGGYSGRHRYRAWRHAHYLGMAQRLLDRHDAQNGLVALRQALDSDPDDVRACRLMADIAEANGSPSALAWRHRVVQLAPGSTPDRLALARLALARGALDLAKQALQAVEESGRQSADFHRTAAAWATASHDSAGARAHFEEVLRLEPNDTRSRVNLMSLRLLDPDPAVSSVARAALMTLRDDSKVRDEALRQLTLDALRRSDTNEALSLSSELSRITNGIFADCTMRLDALSMSGRTGEIGRALTDLRDRLVQDPVRSYEVARWTLTHQGPVMALDWIRKLPPSARTNQPVPVIETDCMAALGSWQEVVDVLETQDWGGDEFVRYLQRSRALRALGQQTRAKAEWTKAIGATGGRLESLSALFRNAAEWQWPSETVEVLWAIVNKYPGELWARQALYSRLLADGQTRGLLNLFSVVHRVNPDDADARNNLALLALLLGARENRPNELAEDLYRSDPTNAAYASTYALSLHLQDRSDEAVKVLDRLRPGALEDPQVAAYYGIVLRGAGKEERAKSYLERGREAGLLPEERRLVEQALAGN